MGTSGIEPPTSRLSGVRSNHLSYAPKPYVWCLDTIQKRVTRIELATTAWKAVVLPLNYTRILFPRKWRETESNRRHMELQSIALPTELPSRIHNQLREQDLNLRPSGYEPDELPSCSIPRYYYAKEDVGFEPTHAFTRLTVFKTVPFSRTWVILHSMDLVGLEPTTARL